jgi:SAM-dependent methyltransferase
MRKQQGPIARIAFDLTETNVDREFSMSDNQKSFDALSKVISFWDEKYGAKFNGYCHPYRDRAIFDNLANFYRSIAAFNNSTADTVGCDLGCWLGFPCLLEAAATGCKMYGIEIQETFTETSREWASEIGADNLSFQHMKNGVVPLESNSVDWILVNQVLCNALGNTFENSIREAARILRPGGTLIICDSNNPYHEPVRLRLKSTYHAAEIGKGTAEEPSGYNFNARKAIVKAIAPQLDAEKIGKIAIGTCYTSLPEIKRAVQDWILNGRLPTRMFEPESNEVPCSPHNGAALGNETNPYLLYRYAEECGLKASINTALTRNRVSQSDLYTSLQSAGSFYVIADKPL